MCEQDKDPQQQEWTPEMRAELSRLQSDQPIFQSGPSALGGLFSGGLLQQRCPPHNWDNWKITTERWQGYTGMFKWKKRYTFQQKVQTRTCRSCSYTQRELL